MLIKIINLNTLTLAENNRFELETVLKHYKDEPQKLAAAKYLIENMPEHYSFADTALLRRYHLWEDPLRIDSAQQYRNKKIMNNLNIFKFFL